MQTTSMLDSSADTQCEGHGDIGKTVMLNKRPTCRWFDDVCVVMISLTTNSMCRFGSFIIVCLVIINACHLYVLYVLLSNLVNSFGNTTNFFTYVIMPNMADTAPHLKGI